MFAEFLSVVSAVACATEIQRGMRERNADAPQDRRMEFRVGVNLGDVPADLGYGQLRLHPYWDPLRGDPRFEKIVASLAPKD